MILDVSDPQLLDAYVFLAAIKTSGIFVSMAVIEARTVTQSFVLLSIVLGLIQLYVLPMLAGGLGREATLYRHS
jgi:hypothetical protein